jgi:pyruvate,orthophosphate dikinase
MPGMMDTVLNLGLNDKIAGNIAQKTGNWPFAYDCYIRFLNMFSSSVLGIDHQKSNHLLEEFKSKKQALGKRLRAGDLTEASHRYNNLVKNETGRSFPQDPFDQLFTAIWVLFNAWNNKRAIIYRKINKLAGDPGFAAVVQVMVYGNMGDDCGAGSAFTRNPYTGVDELYGEYLPNTQFEDSSTLAGTARPVSALEKEMPGIYKNLQAAGRTLEIYYKNIQNIQFVIERQQLYLLQTRNGKPTTRAAIKIGVEMAGRGLITREEAVSRVDATRIDQFLHKRVDPSAEYIVIASGLPASPGAASGKVVFSAAEAEAASHKGDRIILVQTETMPEDIHGITAAQGIITSRGGMASHAAVVARGMGKPCVCGCEALHIRKDAGHFTVGNLTIKKGDFISIDGYNGQVILGEVPVIDPDLSDELGILLNWCDEIRTLGVRANADKPEDAARARKFGAEGIGLARTEHMFMARNRLPVVRDMILSATPEERKKALEILLPMQREDFYQIMAIMNGLPVTIRLLDPPLHEFLPNAGELAVEITRLRFNGGCQEELKAKEMLLGKIRALSEFNPMLGHRGCRLGITFPEIYEMQARAIFEACARLAGEGYDIFPEVEIPLVMDVKELAFLKEMINRVAEAVMSETGVNFRYAVGTMIEVPRAALVADKIAGEAEFFSFGTNDLTQTTLGFSRDDAEGKLMTAYMDKKILEHNPFAVLDRKGVGKLMKTAVELGRRTKPGLPVGICGEHGGEPESVEFCHQIGLDYVSCSPFRVPVARLAAAQARLKQKPEAVDG